MNCKWLCIVLPLTNIQPTHNCVDLLSGIIFVTTCGIQTPKASNFGLDSKGYHLSFFIVVKDN